MSLIKYSSSLFFVCLQIFGQLALRVLAERWMLI